MFKTYREFCVFSKIIYFFMNTYFVPFKLIPTRYYTLVPTVWPILEALQKIIFCDLVQLLLLCRLYLLNRCVASSFHEPLQFREPLEQIWVVADRVQYLLSNVNAMLFLIEIEQFWYEFRGDPCQSICLGPQQLL